MALTERDFMLVEPSAQSRVIAREIHDQFTAFMQAGFSRPEALHLTTIFMSHAFTVYDEFDEE